MSTFFASAYAPMSPLRSKGPAVRSSRHLLCAVALALCLAPASALAKRAGPGSDQAGELYSIEKRDLLGNHELAIIFGSLPKDAFEIGLTLTGSYTYHFSHLIAWEILNGTYSFNVGSGLTEELRERFDAAPERTGVLQAIISSNLVFKPLYGKVAVLNNSLATAEMYFVAGPAIGFFDDQARPFGVNVGLGLRFFLGRYFSFRIDIRDYGFLPNFSKFDNHIYFGAGLALTFGFPKDNEEDI